MFSFEFSVQSFIMSFFQIQQINFQLTIKMYSTCQKCHSEQSKTKLQTCEIYQAVQLIAIHWIINRINNVANLSCRTIFQLIDFAIVLLNTVKQTNKKHERMNRNLNMNQSESAKNKNEFHAINPNYIMIYSDTPLYY